jgi:hypothetical protein
MFNILWVFGGFLVGMIVTTIFVPPQTKHKLVPDVHNPSIVFQNPEVENGCFRAVAYPVQCTDGIDFLNM